jgi:hypothetical protein
MCVVWIISHQDVSDPLPSSLALLAGALGRVHETLMLTLAVALQPSASLSTQKPRNNEPAADCVMWGV